jgi:DNA-binding transcriptional regulator YiaG
MTASDLIQLRKHWGMSQTKFAKWLSHYHPYGKFVARNTVARWESGKFPIPKWAIKELATMNPGQNTPQDAQNSPRIDE